MLDDSLLQLAKPARFSLEGQYGFAMATFWELTTETWPIPFAGEG